MKNHIEKLLDCAFLVNGGVFGAIVAFLFELHALQYFHHIWPFHSFGILLLDTFSAYSRG